MNENWIYLAKNKFTQSGAVGVNFLFNEGNIYISDNHLSALWGWQQQCSPNEAYSFIHIDHHKDLKIPNIYDKLKSISKVKSIDDFLAYRAIDERIETQPYLAYDTYIQIAYTTHPKWFSEMLFLTKECPFKDAFNTCRLNTTDIGTGCVDSEKTIESGKKIKFLSVCDLNQVITGISNNQYEHKVILNLDIDYFFDCDFHLRDSYWSDDKIDSFVQNLQEALNSGNIKVLTIALSPECCNDNGKVSDDMRASYNVMSRFLPILSPPARKEFSSILESKM